VLNVDKAVSVRQIGATVWWRPYVPAVLAMEAAGRDIGGDGSSLYSLAPLPLSVFDALPTESRSASRTCIS
jgi:hypothetical protein